MFEADEDIKFIPPAAPPPPPPDVEINAFVAVLARPAMAPPLSTTPKLLPLALLWCEGPPISGEGGMAIPLLCVEEDW